MGAEVDDLGYVNRHGLSRKVLPMLHLTEDRLPRAEVWYSTSSRLLRTV